MKRFLKVLLFFISLALIFLIGFTIYAINLTSSVKLDETKLINVDNSITFLYSNGEKFSEESGGIEITEISNIPNHVKNAFIAIEDKRFNQHNGVDMKGLFRALLKNFKSGSLKQGGSTITQQLIKNTHLSSEKTLKRKLSEIKLAYKLEKKYTKDEILEKYLNTIYFGNGKYGITEASNYYFSKSPSELTINEGAILASIIKAPAKYSPSKSTESLLQRKNLVLKEMLNQDYVTHNEYENNIVLPIKTDICIKDKSLIDLIKKEYDNIVEDNPYYNKKIEITTSINKEYQAYLEASVADLDYKYSGTILNINNQIEAFISSNIIEKRQVGSTIKPLAVYAPAIEKNIVTPLTKILDEKTDFNGYAPSNYNDKYYGYVSVKESLEKSLNVCAVKLLNEVGVENSINYLKKMQFPIENEDGSLALSLGATKNGATLLELSSCYDVFLNDGNHQKYSVINKITQDNQVIYTKKEVKTKVFAEETTTLTNDMLLSTAQKGTAKKLSTLPFPVYAKTGTVGSKKGNTDAYCISYNDNHVISFWTGNLDNEYLPNQVTGGTLPTEKVKSLWEKVCKDKMTHKEIKKSDNVIEVYIDKISYDNENVLILADQNTPERYKIKGLFNKAFLPKETSTRFSFPQIEKVNIEVTDNEARINYVNNIELIKILIYRSINGEKTLIFDTKNSTSKCFVDKSLEYNTEYEYSIIPYYDNGNKSFYGKEIFLDKIKTPPFKGGDDWWIMDDNEFE